MKAAIPLTALAAILGSASPACVTDTLDIYTSEVARPSSSYDAYVNHTFCPNTTVTLGLSSPPLLFFNPKIRVQCGDDGSSANGCVIDGGEDGSAPGYGSAVITSWSDVAAGYPEGVEAPIREEENPIDVEIVGMTFKGGFNGPFLYSHVPTRVTFRDCVFADGKSTGAALVMEGRSVTPDPDPADPPTAEPADSGAEEPVPTSASTRAPTSAEAAGGVAPVTGAPSSESDPSTVAPAPPPAPTYGPTTSEPTATRSPTASTRPTAPPAAAAPTVPPAIPPAPSPAAPGPASSRSPTAVGPAPSPTLIPLPPGQCDDRRPCGTPEAPCCSKWGACGSGEEWCGAENCISGCPEPGRRGRGLGEDGGAAEAPFEFRFVGCIFERNEVMLDEGSSAIVVNSGGDVVIEDCVFRDNAFPGDGYSVPVASITGTVTVIRTCFLRNTGSAAHVANFAASASTYSGTDNVGGGIVDPGCDGVTVITDGDPDVVDSWVMGGCDPFPGGGTCPSDEGGEPTASPAAGGEGGPTESPAVGPTEPSPTLPPTSAGTWGGVGVVVVVPVIVALCLASASLSRS